MMETGKYILDGQTPVLEPDILKWANWFGRADRIVAKSQVTEQIQVSTVFLGLDHNFAGDGLPILFETMVFGGPDDSSMNRYSTWADAEKGHAEMTLKVRRA